MAGKGSGPGRVQRGVKQVFTTYPNGRFTVREIADMIYAPEPAGRVQQHTVGRVLHKLAPEIGLTRSRVKSPRTLGWEYRWGKAH